MAPRIPLKSYFLFFILLINSSPYSPVQQYGEAYIYSNEPSTLDALLRYFNEKPEWNITVYNINDPAVYERFLEIVNTLIIFVIKDASIDRTNETCLGCALKHLKWEDVVTSYTPPIIGFFHNKRLSAITIGTTDKSIIDEAIKTNGKNGAIMFRLNGTYVLSNEAIRTKLGELFREQKIREGWLSASSLIFWWIYHISIR